MELSYDAEAVRISIADNGRGFLARKTRGRGGFGLSIMKERAARIGADFNLRSGPGKGTRVEVRVPAPSASSEKRPLSR